MLFKILDGAGKSCNGGTYTWDLPQHDKPGAWTEKIVGELEPCYNGYHLAIDENLVYWIPNNPHSEFRLFSAEHAGKSIELNGKLVVEEARLLREVDTSQEVMEKVTALSTMYLCSILPKENITYSMSIINNLARMVLDGERSTETYKSMQSFARVNSHSNIDSVTLWYLEDGIRYVTRVTEAISDLMHNKWRDEFYRQDKIGLHKAFIRSVYVYLMYVSGFSYISDPVIIREYFARIGVIISER